MVNDMQELIFFGNIKKYEIMKSVLDAKDGHDSAKAVSRLVSFGLENNFKGNLWHNYLAYVLAYNENPFSICCENSGKIKGDLDLVMSDIKIFRDLFAFDLKKMSGNLYKNIEAFNLERVNQQFYNMEITDMISKLAIALASAKNDTEFYDILVKFYQKNGVSDLGFHKAFRLGDDNDLIPIKDVVKVDFSDLIGYEYQKEQLIYNTKCFVEKKFANNVLLYGDSGTGKSTSIKAILNMFYKKGLRMIEIYRSQMKNLADLIATLKKRNYFFIIYMDDLSFEESETEYKHLKSIIEGGLEAKPSNVIIYASSNRRHLIKETFADNGGINDDIHRSETAAEKLSLASRFGLQILYMSPSNLEFKKIVKELAKRHHLEISEEELMKKANQWELSHGNLSGRTAEQFIRYISGGKIDL